MATSSAPKAHGKPVAAAPVERNVSAFGVTIADKKTSIAEKPPMTRLRKQVYLLCGLAVFAALLLTWLYWPAAGEDPAVRENPQIKPVLQAAEQKDIPKLQSFVTNNDPIVASRAVTALAGLGHGDVADNAARDNRPEVRTAAVQVLAQRADPAQLPTLAKFMKSDPSPDVRLNALSGVASIKDARAFDPMLDMLNDPSPTLRRAALRALEQKVGMTFSNFDADRPSAAAIAQIRQSVTGFKKTYEAIKELRKGG
jgi:hypothetical protein